jgi:hypothetical protein
MAKKLNKLCAYFHSTDLYSCPKCGIQLRDFKAELRAKVDAIPKERKQELLDHLKDGNVGYAISKVDPNREVDSLIWYTIIGDQIESYDYFNFKAK